MIPKFVDKFGRTFYWLDFFRISYNLTENEIIESLSHTNGLVIDSKEIECCERHRRHTNLKLIDVTAAWRLALEHHKYFDDVLQELEEKTVLPMECYRVDGPRPRNELIAISTIDRIVWLNKRGIDRHPFTRYRVRDLPAECKTTFKELRESYVSQFPILSNTIADSVDDDEIFVNGLGINILSLKNGGRGTDYLNIVFDLLELRAREVSR